MFKPLEIKRLGETGISISWSDGRVQNLTSKALRTNCPCAACLALRGDTSHDAPLSPKKSLLRIVEASSTEETKLINIWGVGNYALGMQWADGHKTGIYTFEYLANLE